MGLSSKVIAEHAMIYKGILPISFRVGSWLRGVSESSELLQILLEISRKLCDSFHNAIMDLNQRKDFILIAVPKKSSLEYLRPYML